MEGRMMTDHFYKLKRHLVMILLPILVSSTIIISSCSLNMPTVDASKKQTDVARSVESTLNAEKVATYQAQQTLDAAQPVATQPASPNTGATIQAQQATLDAQASSQAPQETQPVAAGITPTTESVELLEPIQITDWKMSFWVSLPNGCREGAPCWKTDDDYDKHMGSPLVLTSKQSLLIDPNWPKPYLVFWNNRDNSYPATVELIVDNKQVILKTYVQGKSDWQLEAIDLSRFKGQEIYVQFAVSGKQTGLWGGKGPGSRWFVEDVRIFPNYIG
jgi:hypothetical protein